MALGALNINGTIYQGEFGLPRRPPSPFASAASLRSKDKGGTDRGAL